MLTWRTGIIVALLGLAFAVVWPSVRAYLDQQTMLDGLRADAAVANTELDDLTAEVARWDDDAYIEAQARERLRYVYPGETAYRVLDPETVTGDESAAEEGEEAADAPGETWYDTLWDSVREAGEGAEATASGSPESARAAN
ncbi:septum formation initiator family protein [Demequina sp. NBRC 110057]|uniref:FtsB family cell division protein n=1 Tax=Demequina sp. NBRC 110057 TaxID=1570346 RepID=UPI0009FF13E4|nr:septum formation initiator family protein [Demequina sp. NBRC 110057]